MRKFISLLFVSFILMAIFTSCKGDTGVETNSDYYIESPTEDFLYETAANGEAIWINAYIGESEEVIIPAKIEDLPVTVIRGYEENGQIKGAFQDSNIKSIVLPDSVRVLSSNTFKNCKELSQVTLSKELTTVGFASFENCAKIECLDLTATNVTEIRDLAFSGCCSLKEINLPNTLELIGESAFYGCSALEELNLPKELKKIEKNAFSSCQSLRNVSIPPKVDLIAYESPIFSSLPSLERIVFEEGREEVLGYAFFATNTNVEIIIPESVKSFSPWTFFSYGPAEFVFLGDCPEYSESEEFTGTPSIYYNPLKKGWDVCSWKDKYDLKPM